MGLEQRLLAVGFTAHLLNIYRELDCDGKRVPRLPVKLFGAVLMFYRPLFIMSCFHPPNLCCLITPNYTEKDRFYRLAYKKISTVIPEVAFLCLFLHVLQH